MNLHKHCCENLKSCKLTLCNNRSEATNSQRKKERKKNKKQRKCVRGEHFGYVIRIMTACGEEKCMPETNLCALIQYTYFPNAFTAISHNSLNVIIYCRYKATTAEFVTLQT
jgi:hypothetical protein